MTFLLALLLLALAARPVQVAQPGDTARACASGWNGPRSATKPKHAKPATKESQGSACIELPFSALEVQEYAQAYTHTQEWKIADEHLTEDSWTFSLALDKNGLLSNTAADSRPEKVQWRSAIVLVQISSAPLPDGFTRTIIRAAFRGYGESPDQFAAQKQYWELHSNGSFESKLVSALKEHFGRVS